MNIVRILLWVAAVALAGLVGASSAVIASQVKYPSRSVAIGVGPMGQAKANLAFASYAVRQKQDPKAVISARERALASMAYRSEPLSSAALGLLIASMDQADVARRQGLLDLGGRLTRRSSLITSASIVAAAQRGDEVSFFSWLSRGVSANVTIQSVYVRAMAQATARPGAVAALAPVIGPRPIWSDLYWHMVAGVPASLENAAKLRALIAGPPWRQTEISDTDRGLVERLVQYGHYDAVRQMAAALNRARPSGGRNGVVVDADFSRPSAVPPIDWQLASSGNLGATIETKRKLLSISAIAGARGYAARQLVELTPGAYEMAWNLAANAPLGKDVLTIRVACAEPGRADDIGQAFDLGVGHRRAGLTIADNGCRWHWLSVNVDIPDMSAGIDAQLSGLSVKRVVRAEPAASNQL